MPSQYKPKYPATPPVAPGIKQFFEKLYALADDPTSCQEYADQFTEDAVMIVGSIKRQGKDNIGAMMHKVWQDAVDLEHRVIQAFPFNSPIGSPGFELMLHGTVEKTLKDGSHESKDWAARAQLVMNPRNRVWKLVTYQVYMVSSWPASSDG